LWNPEATQLNSLLVADVVEYSTTQCRLSASLFVQRVKNEEAGSKPGKTPFLLVTVKFIYPCAFVTKIKRDVQVVYDIFIGSTTRAIHCGLLLE
jgi:hypothetical protein